MDAKNPAGMRVIHTLLIANRGEIAARIIRSCRRMGIRAVAVYSLADQDAPYVRLADMAVCLGESAAKDSYLHQEKIIAAALRMGADAIHPGYGFLSENAAFARRCQEAGLIFVGPNPGVIETMGSKAKAKAIMQASGIPVIPGYQGTDQSIEKLSSEAASIGFPVLIKASAGGGGKGMRLVHEASKLEEAIEAARREAIHAFGDGELLIEKYFASARHIEFQIFGDQHGHLLHLHERECSIQRRHQKVMEESPSPALTAATRQRMAEAALQAAKAIGYDNAGTVEFILTGQEDFFFLEVNTRLQVEHPVTEAVTGIDLVQWQLEIAEGKPLPLSQEQIATQGYALEFRLYAEDARNHFLPVAGTILHWETPQVEGLRWETAVESGSTIGIHYDPMIAKIIAHGPTRAEAFRRMQYALEHLICLGLTTNLPFLQRLSKHPDIIAGHYDTHFIEKKLELSDLYEYPAEIKIQTAIALCLHRWNERQQKQILLSALPAGWRSNFFQYQTEHYRIIESDYRVKYRFLGDKQFEFCLEETLLQVVLLETGPEALRFELDGIQYRVRVAAQQAWYFLHLPGVGQIIAEVLPRFPQLEVKQTPGNYTAPMPGEITRVMVEAGQEVKAGDSLLVLVSMKMENTIAAAGDGLVESVFVQEKERVEAGTLLLKLNTQQH